MKEVIVVASHKNVEIPKDNIYCLCEVNANKQPSHFSDFRDNQGINISEKNNSFCELTALYEAWKNLDYDVLGLVHYRRYFLNSNSPFEKKVITKEKIENLLQNYDVILPKKRHYWIESNYSHYVHAHHREPLDKTRIIIAKYYPDYLDSFDFVMKQTSGHYFNMVIAKKEVIDKYCTWLFDILFKVEKVINIDSYDASEQRVFGYISELLLNVFVRKEKLRIKRMKYKFLGKQNWAKKISNFIQRKIRGAKE